MKLLFISLLFSISITNAFANGVVVGDGHPTELTKQERLDSTGVDKELAAIVTNLSAFDPAIAHILNVGVKALREKKIVLIKIVDASHEHFAFIEDGNVEPIKDSTTGLISYSLVSRPTIYFYKNFFDLNNQNPENFDEITKVKVVIHEFMHMYLGSSELKVQRVTDLIYKISTGQFETSDLENLRFELSIQLAKLEAPKLILDVPKKFSYGCFIDVGLETIPFSDDGSIIVTAPPKNLIENFSALTSAAQAAFKANTFLYYNELIKDAFGNSRCKKSQLEINSLNYNKVTYKNFIQFLFNNDMIGPKSFDLTATQLQEIANSSIPIKSFQFSVQLTETRSKSYNVKVETDTKNVRLPVLNEKSFIKISDFNNVSNTFPLYENAKNLFLATRDGSLENIPAKIVDVQKPAAGKLAILEVGAFNSNDLDITIHGLGNFVLPKDLQGNSSLTISPTTIIFNSNTLQINRNATPFIPYKLETINTSVYAEVIE